VTTTPAPKVLPTSGMAEAPAATVPAREISFRNHMPGLDGLRGSMLPFLLLAHFYLLTPGANQPIDLILNHLRETGWIVLDVFFVMSGFLITGILVDTKSEKAYFRNFYARRFLRIFPVYYGTLFIYFVVLPRLGVMSPANVQELLDLQGWCWSYLSNLYFARPDLETGTLAVLATRHFWSLAVEEQYYLLWPLVVFLCGRRRLVQCCLLMIVGAFAFRTVGVFIGAHPRQLYALTFARMDDLAMGSLLAIVIRAPGGYELLRRWARPLVAAGAVFMIAVIAATGEFSAFRPFMQSVGYSVVGFGAAGLIIIAGTSDRSTRTGRFFSHPFLIRMGTYSYAVYVVHILVYLVIQGLVPSIDHLPLIAGYGWPSSVARMLFLSTAAIFAGFLSWNLYEKQVLKLKRYFSYGPRRGKILEPRPEPVTPAVVSPAN
jgi:peptidoglycan/LPS O-acetylase OafA/YrhL